jgi:hypothetical protein
MQTFSLLLTAQPASTYLAIYRGLTKGLTLNRTLRYTPKRFAVLFSFSHTDEVPVRPSHRKHQLHICLQKFAQPFQKGV